MSLFSDDPRYTSSKRCSFGFSGFLRFGSYIVVVAVLIAQETDQLVLRICGRGPRLDIISILDIFEAGKRLTIHSDRNELRDRNRHVVFGFFAFFLVGKGTREKGYGCLERRDFFIVFVFMRREGQGNFKDITLLQRNEGCLYAMISRERDRDRDIVLIISLIC
jgi:hypothetical protein